MTGSKITSPTFGTEYQDGINVSKSSEYGLIFTRSHQLFLEVVLAVMLSFLERLHKVVAVSILNLCDYVPNVRKEMF